MVPTENQCLQERIAKHNADGLNVECPRPFLCVFIVVTVIAGMATAGLAQPIPDKQSHAEPRSDGLSPVSQIDFVSGRTFQEALQQPITIGWSGKTLRGGLMSLMSVRKVAIVLDRRIDPDQEIGLQLRDVSLVDLLGAVAESAGGQLSVLENFVYIGPESVAHVLRTVIAIRNNELIDAPSTSTSQKAALTRRRFELFKRRTFGWNAFARPEQILKDAAEQFELTIDVNSIPVPHDLWPAVNLPASTSVEILSVILAQFGLTFVWQDNANSVKVVRLPENPQLERTWDLLTRNRRTLAAKIPRQFPDLKVAVAGAKLKATGTYEQLEEINDFLFPRARPQAISQRPKGPKTLKFTFRVRGGIEAIMEGLEKQSDLEFKYDAAKLKASGIDLNQKVDLQMKDADTAELCKALFQDTMLDYSIDGTVISVFAK